MFKKLQLMIFVIALISFLSFFSSTNYILSSTDKIIEGIPLSSNISIKSKIDYPQKEKILDTYTPPLKEYPLGRGKLVFYPGEGYQNKWKNIDVAFKYLNGYVIKPGEIFSYNKVIHLLDPNLDSFYYPGIGLYSVMSAAGVCSGSTLMATTIKNAGFTFLDTKGLPESKPVPHPIYLPEYHRTFNIDGQNVPIVDATVSSYVGSGGKYYSATDVSFRNDTKYSLVIRVDGDYSNQQYDSSYIFERDHGTVNLNARINILDIL